MDPFSQLNYCYPGRSSNAARLHVSQHPPGFPHHAQTLSFRSMDQTSPGAGYTHSGSSRIAHALALPGTPGHDLRLQQNTTPVVSRSAVLSEPEWSLKIRYLDGSANQSDQYIPSSSDKITCKDHRPLDEIFGNIRSSSSSAWSGLPPPSQNGTPQAQIRPTSVLTYPLPSKPQLDGVLQIPLLAVDNQMSGTDLVVDFRCSDWGIGVEVKGIPMTDLLHGNSSGLESPHQRVLEGLGIINLRFNILWPHYPLYVKMISAFGTDGKPITRAGLGYEVSLAFAEFFYQITSQGICSAQTGPYMISSSPTGSSSPGIKYEQLHLITVRNTSRGEWIAEIRAVSLS